MKMIRNLFHHNSRGRSDLFRSVRQFQIHSDFMRKDLLTIGLAVFLSGVATFSTFGADPAAVTLRGHVPAVVSHGQTTPVGQVGGETVLNLSIGLPLRNRVALTHLVEQVSDPASPVYGQYLTSREFTDRFGPTAEDYEKVISFARKNGLTVTRTHENRMLLNVSGKAADIERAFSVTLREYQHPTEKRMFYAPDREPSVPGGLAILDISGLDNYRRPHPNYRIKPQQSSSSSAQKSASKVQANATTGSGPFGLYVGDDFRKAYVPDTTLNGSGQTIALVQFDGYLASDIVAYENLVGRPNIPLKNVLIDGFSGVPTGNGGEVEVSLDIEMVVSMAPALAEVILYEGDPFNFHPNDVLNQIAVDNSARQVSCSWGWTGGPSGTTDQIFQEMIVQGQSFFDAVGDSDAFLPGEVDDPNFPGEPSSTPFITQVGGTTLTMNGVGASYASETVWNWDIRFGPSADGQGSSGGISTFYRIPSYQANVNMTLPQGSQTFRNVPDVALTADDVLVIADGGAEISVGGTSCASPLWAGFTALVNQQAAINGHSGGVGFLNPALYAIAAGPNYTNCFHDITTDANTWSQSPSLFFAVKGYDLCTGLGTPNGANLINAILAFNGFGFHISPPPPPYGTNLSAVSGINPNGAWSLYIQDDTPLNSGFVSNGWVLSLTLADIVGTAGDLQVLISPTNTSALVGQSVALSLSVTNYGPSASTNVTVLDDLPTGVVLVSSNATQGTVTKQGAKLVWSVGTLAANTGAGLALTIQPNSVGTLVDSATAQAGTPDPNPDDDSALATIHSTPVSFSLVPTATGGGHNLQIGVPGPIGPGVTVVIQANSNLISTNWVNIYTSTPPFNFVDPAASNYVQRFYRAVVP
jgi:uncharacterized repeat protein (TIGR01451 family)